MQFSTFSRRILGTVFFAISAGTLIVSSDALKGLEAEQDTVAAIDYLPKASHLRPFLLGHEGFVADLYWIKTLGYVGDRMLAGRKVERLEALVDLMTDLDPRFEQVYIWAGAFLMYSGGAISKEKIEASNRMLEKGWRRIQNNPTPYRHAPNYWMIPQMIGFNYAMELKDKARGAPFIAAAARLPGAPDLYKTFAATLFQKGGRPEEGARFLEDMLAVETLQSQLENTEDTTVQKRIRVRLEFYLRRLYGEQAALQRLNLLEAQIRQLVGEWRETFPYLPFDLYLVLRRDPEDPVESEMTDVWIRLFPLTGGAV